MSGERKIATRPFRTTVLGQLKLQTDWILVNSLSVSGRVQLWEATRTRPGIDEHDGRGSDSFLILLNHSDVLGWHKVGF